MEKLNLRKNPGDILYAADISSIVSTINNIITYITSENGSGSGSESGGSVGDVVDIPSPIITWGNRIPTPWTEDGYNEFGLPWGIWLQSYLTSDLENPIHERLLYESEYTQYLGSGYEINTNVSITYKNEQFRDELFNEPMQVSLYPSGSTDFSKATLNKDWYKISGIPRMWDVLIDVTGVDSSNTYGVKDYAYNYRQFIEENEVLFHLNWGDELYNKAVEMQSTDEDPIIGFTGTMSLITGDNNAISVTESVNIPINPARDLSLDHLFVIIPAKSEKNPNGLCTWTEFKADPQYYLQQIKLNDYNATITEAKTLYENDIMSILKETIIRNGTDRFGLDFGTDANPTSYRQSLEITQDGNDYLSQWKELCRLRRLDMRNRAEDIVIGWFKKYCADHPNSRFIIDGDYGLPGETVPNYGIVQNPGVTQSDFDGIWDSSLQIPRYTGNSGYCYTSIKNISSIPRFDKIYCLDDIGTGGPYMRKGPINDMNTCPRYEGDDARLENAIDCSWWANEGDIVVELTKNKPENHHTIEYYVMHGDEHNMHTEQLFPEQMFDIANSTAYIQSTISKVDIFYRTHPEKYRKNTEPISIQLPYEDVLNISTGAEIPNNDGSITSHANNQYARYGGDYTIFAFEVGKKFCIKDIKWGFSETLDLGRG